MDNHKILRVLRDVEFAARGEYDTPACPKCYAGSGTSHAKDCELAEAIRHFETDTKAVRAGADKAVRAREDK